MKKVVASALLSLITATGVAANSNEVVKSSSTSASAPTLVANKLTYPQNWFLISRIFAGGLGYAERQYVRVDFKQYTNNKLTTIGYNASCQMNNAELLELWVDSIPYTSGVSHTDVNVSVCSQPDQVSDTIPPPVNPTCVTMASLAVNAQIDAYGNVTTDLPQYVVDLSPAAGQPSPCLYSSNYMQKPIVQHIK